jgi:hypothetical protein
VQGGIRSVSLALSATSPNDLLIYYFHMRSIRDGCGKYSRVGDITANF